MLAAGRSGCATSAPVAIGAAAPALRPALSKIISCLHTADSVLVSRGRAPVGEERRPQSRPVGRELEGIGFTKVWPIACMPSAKRPLGLQAPAVIA
jgi:hypothetical protein